MARRTPLGWTATGPTFAGCTKGQEEEFLLFCRATAAPVAAPEEVLLAAGPDRVGPDERQLNRLIEQMLEMEEEGEGTVLSPREQYVISQMRKSLTRRGKQYQVACTWAPGSSRPPYNFDQALRRLEGLETGKYFREDAVRQAYTDTFLEWEREGFIKEVPLQSEQVRHLLAHFPVL